MTFNQEEYFSQLAMLVNIDSGSYDPEGVNRVVDFFEEQFCGLGFCIKRHRLASDVGDCLVITNSDAQRYDVLLIGHLDTVFPRGTAQRRPYRSDGVNAYGPGVADMKNGALAILHVLKGLSQDALQRLSICVILNPDEEIFSTFSEKLTIEAAKKSDYAFVMESAMPNGEHCVKRKGMIRFEVEFRGVACHSGYVFETPNASAILELSEWVRDLSKLENIELGTSVNIGVVSGGIAANVVPDNAQAEVEIRMWEQSEVKRVEARIEYLLEHPFIKGTRARIIEYKKKNPMEPSRETIEYLKRVESIASSEGFEFKIKPRGGLSDGNTISLYTPVCLDGMGPSGGLDHGEKEYMIMRSASECVSLISALLEDISQSKSLLQCN